MSRINYYQVLGVSENATQNEIRQSYRRLALKFHPDKYGGSDFHFKQLQEAYEFLSDHSKRLGYVPPITQRVNTVHLEEFSHLKWYYSGGSFYAPDFGCLLCKDHDWKKNSEFICNSCNYIPSTWYLYDSGIGGTPYNKYFCLNTSEDIQKYKERNDYCKKLMNNSLFKVRDINLDIKKYIEEKKHINPISFITKTLLNRIKEDYCNRKQLTS